MKKFRLKKEAVPFVLSKHATKIYDLETWNSLGIDINALEEVKAPFIFSGIKRSDTSTDLSGWNKEDGSQFHFTINFPSVKFQEHDAFAKGRNVRELMNKIQNAINNFYDQFIESN